MIKPAWFRHAGFFFVQTMRRDGVWIKD